MVEESDKKPKRGRGRPVGYRMPERVRERIRTGVLVTRLTQHVEGKVDMRQTQVTAALGLLKKVLPDLSSTDLTSGGEALSINVVKFGDD
jgi:hypothetical protein